MTSCPLPRTAVVTDTPHTQIGDLDRQRQAITSLDLDGCNVAYIVMAMNEYELKLLDTGKVGHRTHTWPEGLRNDMERELERWLVNNGNKAVRGFTQGINDGCCVMAVHWRPR